MAADEEEDGPSEKKNDLSNNNFLPISTMYKELENKLTSTSLSYRDKVLAILSSWDLFASSGSKGLLPFANSLYKWTLKFVLQGEWPNLENLIKTRLSATLRKCLHESRIQTFCKTLIPLVSDPWGHHTLKAIIAGSYIPDDEIEKYIFEETWSVARARIDTLIESRCEEIAFSLLKVCIRCIKIKSDMAEILLNSHEDHNHFVDLYYILLHKFEEKQFLEEVKQMDIIEGVDHIRRLLAKQGKEKVWKHRLKIAELEIQVFLASVIVQPFTENFTNIFREWCSVMKQINDEPDIIVQMIRKYIPLAESSQHIYSMGSILLEKFGDNQACLVTELFIRALTLDMNSLEVVKLKSDEEDSSEQTTLEHQLASGFMELSIVFKRHESVARECILTAFSLHPTPDRLDKIEGYAKRKMTSQIKSPTKTERPSRDEANNNTSPGHDSGEGHCDLKIKTERKEVSVKSLDSDHHEAASIPCIHDYPDSDLMKVKDEIDSMDGFLASTEDLIEQLNQGKEEQLDGPECFKEPEHNLVFDILSDPQSVLNNECLGISKELCDDLAVVLSSPRWHLLSWRLEKNKLLNVCQKYLLDSKGVRNVTQELKYLNIDYSQFQHMPSIEIDEFYGIEKGYEQYMDTASDEPDVISNCSSSEEETEKPFKQTSSGRGKKSHLKRCRTDSDSSSHSRRTSLDSESENDAAFDSATSEVVKKEEEFEGKRITAISCNDRRKRLRVDATTGRVMPSRGRPYDNLRLYRHQNATRNPVEANADKLKSHNLNKPKVILNYYNRDTMETAGKKNYPSSNASQTSGNATSVDSSSTIEQSASLIPSTYQKERPNGNWRYAGYIVGRKREEKSPVAEPSISIIERKKELPSESYRTKEGHLFANKSSRDSNVPQTLKTYGKNFSGNTSAITNKHERGLGKLFTNEKPKFKDICSESNVPKNLKTIESSLEYLKKQGTSVIFKSTSTEALANAQKTVLNEIMSPENSTNTIVGRSSNQELPVRVIAMPVSHTPPNLPPDKNNPPGINRVLPRGTTVVRKPKVDSGAGPSGLNNGGGTTVVITRTPRSSHEPRPNLTLTPSTNFLGSAGNVLLTNTSNSQQRLNVSRLTSPLNQTDTIQGGSPMSSFNLTVQSDNEIYPLASATVLGSVPQTLSPRLSAATSSPAEVQGDCFTNLSLARTDGSANITANTVVTRAGEIRAPSMLETLLRDRSTPSPLVSIQSSPGSNSSTVTTASFPDPIVASSLPITGTSSSLHLSEPVNVGNASCATVNSSLMLPSSNDFPNVNINEPVSSSASLSMVSSSVSSPVFPSSYVTSVISSGINSQTVAANNPSVHPTSMHQLLLPAQFIQVQGTDGSTGLGIVHSGSLDLRLPPGTRVIKSSTNNLRPNTPVALSQNTPRPLNILHNVKLVQNRQVVRTVVVPHSVAVQGLGQQGTHLIALSQNAGASNIAVADNHTVSKVSSPQFKNVLGQSVVPGGLVIKAVRSSSNDQAVEGLHLTKPTTSIIQNTTGIQLSSDKERTEKTRMIISSPHEEDLGQRLNQQYLKTALLSPSSSGTQNVGTQTQTTAVKPVAGQVVNQLVMNQLRGIPSHSAVNSISVTGSSGQSVAIPSSSNLNHLPSLSSTNAVSSETLEQLREFESVFEKVSNKSVKETDASRQATSHAFTPSASTEESMIAAQLLSMANDTSSTTVSTSSYVYTVPASSAESMTLAINSSVNSTVSSRVGEETYITIPHSTANGTLILVNPSTGVSNAINLANAVSTVQPPPPASPALSTSSSHSSIASSPSSSSSKSKNKNNNKPKASPSSAPVTPTKPKSPPPPKAPAKPAVTKPQVEESDETKARIQAILDQYKQDLANTPQPQPAPRNRKNCPPPKNDGKLSSKKKGSVVKKPDGSATASPSDTSDNGQLPSASPSPAPMAIGLSEDSDGSTTGPLNSTNSYVQGSDEKNKTEEVSTPQVLQGVVVSNVKVDGTPIVNSLPTLPQGRVVQLIRHGNKVTAITTRQPYQKGKLSHVSGGPPPNVTIQGRINMSDLVETHLASLLAGGSATINQSSALITKLIQAQQQNSHIQQVVVQTPGNPGQQVIQQVSLQPLVASHAKTPGQVICVTAGSNSSIKHSSPVKASLISLASSATSSTISPSPSAALQSLSSPTTPSAPEPPATPSSFHNTEVSDSSSDSVDLGSSEAPLPPFFTLTKQYMIPSQEPLSTNRSSRTLSKSVENSSNQTSLQGETLQQRSSLPTSMAIQLSFSKAESPSSIISTSKSSNLSASTLLSQSAPPSPLISTAENLLGMSPASGSSSLEDSPLISHRIALLSSELKTNSRDSLKSDPSVEEANIPPSPATLTKQLQNAYMTDAALSPTVSQSSHMLSGQSVSSPTARDLQLAGESRCLSPHLGSSSHSFSSAELSSRSINANSVGRNNSSIDTNALACLSSPCDDVYLDHAEVGLGLENIPLGGEGRSQSPSLSDLVVPAAPMLSWSPRSADSMMGGNSPTLNEALSGNITLEAQNSEDSLCDSSTGFPGLFSMDGDNGSISSNASDDVHNNASSISGFTSTSNISTALSGSTVSHPTSSSAGFTFISAGKRVPNHEQDHTISSTQSDQSGIQPSISSSNFARKDSENDRKVAKFQESNSSNEDSNTAESWKLTDSVFSTSALSRESEATNVAEPNDVIHSELELSSGVPNESVKTEGILNGKHKNQSSAAQELLPSKNYDDHVDEIRPPPPVLEDADKVFKMTESPPAVFYNGCDAEDSKRETKEEIEDSDTKPATQKRKIHDTRSHRGPLKNRGSPPRKRMKAEVKQEEEEESALVKKEVKENEEELVCRVTRGAKKRGEIESSKDENHCRISRSKTSTPSNALGPGDDSVEEDKSSSPLPEDHSGAPSVKVLRRRHVSGASDSSSNYSVDRVSTPGLQDSPMDPGNSSNVTRRRKRRSSRDSSISSRDGSPLTIHASDAHHLGGVGGTVGVSTRRSSSREHSKKSRCRCCGDHSSSSSSTAVSHVGWRPPSTRSSRASNSASSSSQ